MTTVENRRKLVLRDHFVEWIGHPVIGKESLQRRMELESTDHAVLQQTARFAHAHLALVRVDARESHHDVGVFARGVRNFFIRNSARTEFEFGIDREHHEPDLALAVVGNGLGDRRPLAGLEVLRGRILEGLPHFIRLVTARDFGMRVYIDRNQILHVHDCALFARWSRSHSAILSLRSTSSTSKGAGSQCMGPKRSRYRRMPFSNVSRPRTSAWNIGPPR